MAFWRQVEAVTQWHCVGRFCVVMVPPSFNDDLGFTQGIGRFPPIQQFIPLIRPVEAFAVPVLPG